MVFYFSGGLLFAINGPYMGDGTPETQGLTININTGDLVSIWNTDTVNTNTSPYCIQEKNIALVL